MASAVQFDERAHQYSTGGKKVLSVTQAIKAAGLVPDEFFNEEAAERGKAVHMAARLYDEHNMETLRVHLRETKEYGIEGYLDGWIDFLKVSKFKVRKIEHLVSDPARHYAGRLDREGMLNGQEAVLDLKSNKTGRVWPTAALQLAAYVNPLRKGRRFRRFLRVAVALRPDGKFNCIEYKMRDFESDLQDFFVVLQAARIRQRLGVA